MLASNGFARWAAVDLMLGGTSVPRDGAGRS